MSRFAHHNPDDPEAAMERMIDRADDAKNSIVDYALHRGERPCSRHGCDHNLPSRPYYAARRGGMYCSRACADAASQEFAPLSVDRADHAKAEARGNAPASDLRVALAGMLAIIDARPDIGVMLGFQEWAAIQAARNALARADQPIDINKCPSCGRDFPNGGTCQKGGCPMGGDF